MMKDQSGIRQVPTRENAYLNDHARLLVESFRRWTGRALLECDAQAFGRELFYAPFVIASHDTCENPVFNYANLMALQAWETNWEVFTSLPSRASAGDAEQAERAEFMARVSAEGFVTEYSGLRISTLGRQFRIHDATVWNVVDDAGVYHGQAVWFERWDYLE